MPDYNMIDQQIITDILQTLDERLPTPNDKRLALHVKPAAERALRKGHPWLFDEAIRKQNHEGAAGDLAVIFDKKRKFLAIGLYDPDSPIRVKVLQHRQQASIDDDWFVQRIQAAAAIRAPLVDSGTTGYRLVHGENDGLPGLIVDRYADTLVLKLYTRAWLPHLRAFIPALLQVQPCQNLVLRLSRNLQADATYNLNDGDVLGGDGLQMPITFTENGLTFAADVINGHKTGFFFDQRDNRALAGKLARGRNVLDVFAYVGAFSLYAARGGAASVLSLDVSEPALQAARHNFGLNQDDANVAQANHDIMVADAFEGLQTLHNAGRQFNMVIVDPPTFAKQEREVEAALASYRKLTQMALTVLAPSGVLVMASCSSRVSPDDFFATVNQAASDADRPLLEHRRTGHALDHPISFAEGAYLKCLFASSVD